jgi:dihydrofolate synthase / folylpolyglutamate synthase
VADLDAALAYLDAHVNLEAGRQGGVAPPTLDRIRALLNALGDPERGYPLVHLTGTNGKGSTARMVTALVKASGLTVGTYTSPHLERINERIAWNGEPLDDRSFAAAVATVAAVERVSGVRPTFFEILTAAAYAWFADVAVDVAVAEVGLLGRWDATNAADATVAVVTNVGLDHTEYAGGTKAAIAAEKAGIVKPGSWLVLGETDPELAAIFRDAGPAGVWERDRDFACEDNLVGVGGRVVTIRTPGSLLEDVFLPVHGAHQGDNAALAVAAVEALFGRPLTADVVADAFADLTVPGRFEVLARRPLVVLDGAHNPDGAEAAAATLDDDFSVAGDRILVVGMNRGRDPEEMLLALDAPAARLVVACAPDWARARPAVEVARAAEALGVDAVVARDVASALRTAVDTASPDDAVLVTGSLYVVGEARTAWFRDRTVGR